MKIFTDISDPAVAKILLEGGIGILRTDTIYGIVGRAVDERAISRIYDVKGRRSDKSPIVLIDSLSQLFDAPDDNMAAYCQSMWPGKVSIILPATHAPAWIERGNGSVAYRLPDHAVLRSLIRTVGPLAAPSANLEGQPPAMTIEAAQQYFGDEVDFYVDGGPVEDNTPSRLVRFHADGRLERLR